MTKDRAFYCVVQFCPDPAKAEAANVGVLLFRAEPHFLEVRLSESMKRVQHFFRPGRKDLERIEYEVAALGQRLKHQEITTEEQLAQFVASRADRVRLAAPRLVKIGDPREDLQRLYDQLVGSHGASSNARQARPTLPPSVSEIFGRMEAAGTLTRPGRVVVPVIETALDVPFAFRNGIENLVKPESFRAGSHSEGSLARLGFAGQLLHNHPQGDRERQLVVLSADPLADVDREDRAARSLQEFSVLFVRAGEAEEFAAEAERRAHRA